MEARTEPPSRVGACVAERYSLLRVIGRGGMSTVYEAEHVVTHRRVAVKTIDASVALSVPTIALRFLREARAAATIRHPGLVDVLDAGQEDDGSLYLVLELLDGEDLERALRHGNIEPADVTDVMIEVIDALEAMHAVGFVHRDVKPANIFLARTRDGARQVKLLDLGIAKQITGASVTEITATGVLLGTLHFMAPEQAVGRDVDARADVWGVGATLFYAWASRPPFMAAAPAELLRMLLEDAPPAITSMAPTIPIALAEVIDRALERTAKRRFGDAATMRRALERARDAKPRYASIEISDTKELAPPVVAPRRPWGATVVGAVLAGALVGWMLRPGSPSRVKVEALARSGEPNRRAVGEGPDRAARVGVVRADAGPDRAGRGGVRAVRADEPAESARDDDRAWAYAGAERSAGEPTEDAPLVRPRRVRARAAANPDPKNDTKTDATRTLRTRLDRGAAPRATASTGTAGGGAPSASGGGALRGEARGTAPASEPAPRRAEDPMRDYE